MEVDYGIQTSIKRKKAFVKQKKLLKMYTIYKKHY